MKLTTTFLILLTLSCQKTESPLLKFNCTKLYEGDTISIGFMSGYDIYFCVNDHDDIAIGYLGTAVKDNVRRGEFSLSKYNGNTYFDLQLNQDTVVKAPNGVKFEVKYLVDYVADNYSLEWDGTGYSMQHHQVDSAATVYLKAIE